ncbi:hypothetical protein [Rhizobium sp. CSW-27]|uniref:hypothetical protein n=1 Tax=Rhizobium sp. CSW-27 TaxID=2839985 RepID=UPI001C00B254|nr:hypothetical protein [Rhizobium sp. CSW-27]MBT9370925.1 hypothetical protein [Rhizobium sp. CSW-27]
MTIIIDHRPVRRSSRWPGTRISHRQTPGPLRQSLSDVLSAASRWIAAQRIAHRRRQTARMLEALPYDLRKDIGWPAGGSDKAERS